MRRYPEAAEAFAAVPQDDETRIARARCFARSGDVEGAARELERIGQQSRSEQGARARLLAGLLLEGEGETERALELFDAVVRTGGTSNWADEALWQLGWGAYRAGRFTDAMGHFARLEARAAGSAHRPAPALLARACGAARGSRRLRCRARRDRAQLSVLVLRMAREHAGRGRRRDSRAGRRRRPVPRRSRRRRSRGPRSCSRPIFASRRSPSSTGSSRACGDSPIGWRSPRSTAMPATTIGRSV